MENFLSRYLNALIEERVQAKLAAMPETDATIYIGAQTAGQIFRDRFNWDRATILRETLLAWRTNPIARRIVDATKEFVVGSGFSFENKHNPTANFIREFWNNPLNNLDEQIGEWVDETTRTGDLFLLCSVDAAGMTFVRAIPSERITSIQTKDNDYRQETAYITDQINADPYPAYDPNQQQDSFVLHFPVNRPVGVNFGESDLTPVLKWLGRLTTLIADRVVLNHLRNLIIYLVNGDYDNETERRNREKEINQNPPTSGSTVVTDKKETWSVLAPRLEASDAAKDILAVKKMIAAGIGLPLHYLAEPESSTRTTAAAAGTPTFRKFQSRQDHFKRLLATLVQIAIERRARIDKTIDPKQKTAILADDITERDNSILALAAARIQPTLADLFDRNLITEADLLAIYYAMLGMDYDKNATQPQGIRAPVVRPKRASKKTEPEDNEDQPKEGDK